GYCFEHNNLLREVLARLGFAVAGLAARVVWQRPPDSPLPRTHMLLRVTLAEGVFLADVGFGGLTLTAPLRMATDLEQQTPHEPHRLVARGGDEWELQARLDGDWAPLYRFTQQVQLPVDYEVANWFTATYPASLFTENLMCARPDADCRYALFNDRLTIRRRGRPAERRALVDAGDLAAILERDFHVTIARDDRRGQDRVSAVRHARRRGQHRRAGARPRRRPRPPPRRRPAPGRGDRRQPPAEARRRHRRRADRDDGRHAQAARARRPHRAGLLRQRRQRDDAGAHPGRNLGRIARQDAVHDPGRLFQPADGRALSARPADLYQHPRRRAGLARPPLRRLAVRRHRDRRRAEQAGMARLCDAAALVAAGAVGDRHPQGRGRRRARTADRRRHRRMAALRHADRARTQVAPAAQRVPAAAV